MQWAEVKERDPIFLNFGGQGDCHPKPNYENYICVDLEPKGEFSVAHDLTKTIPLPDNSAEGILSEHFFEHILADEIGFLLAESYRILKPGSMLRIAVPDYHSPRNLKYLEQGYDPTHTDRKTLTNYPLLKELTDASPFIKVKYYQYWDGDNFVYRKIDYSKGMIQRTADNDARNFRKGFFEKLFGIFQDFTFIVRNGSLITKNEALVQRGHPLRMTSIVIDLIKE